jgi:hypothetical protein
MEATVAGFTIKKDLSVSMVAANIYSLVFAVPLAAVFISLFWGLWGKNSLVHARDETALQLPLFALLVLLGIFLHELIHGAAWALLGKKSLKTIHYGMNWKVLSPYAHCREPLQVGVYRLGAILPGIILGFIPAIAGILSGMGWIFLYSLIFTVAAGGDMVVLWLLRHEDSREWVLDHESRAGCCLIELNSPEKPMK